MQNKNKNCTSLNYFNWYKQTQQPHPKRKIFNHINGNLYHYAGNNPVRYIDPDGRETEFFNYNKYIETQLKGNAYGFMAGCQDAIGQFMNGLSSIFSVKPKVTPLGEATLSIGKISITGTASYENGNIILSGTTGAELSSAQLGKLVGVSVSLDGESISAGGEILIPTQFIVDVKINGGAQINKNGTVTITMKAGVGKNVDLASVGVYGGAELTFGWDTQNGPYGTVQNRKNESLNQNVQKYNYSKSIRALENCLEN